jgi:hypothetical protein
VSGAAQRPEKRQRAKPGPATLLFAAVFAFSLLGSFYRLDDYPPFYDFDLATEGILVNNLNFQESYDHGFSSPPRDRWESQHHYRADFAAHRLPLTIPLAWIQSALGCPPQRVDLLLKALGGVVALLASALIAARLLDDWLARAFFMGALCVHPAFFLLIRTGAFYWLLTFSLFWLAVLLMWIYCHDMKRRYVYALAVVAAYLAMNPYPPVAVLPPILLTIASIEKRLGRMLRDRHLYLAATLSLLIFAGGTYGIALRYEGALQPYLEKVQRLREQRKNAFSIERNLLGTPLSHKLEKLVNQHLLFQRDDLGDDTRPDHLWTLGALHRPFVVMAPLALFGLAWGLWRRERRALLVASVLLWTYAVFLTVSFPEGRFIMVVVPCYLYFSTAFLFELILPFVRHRQVRIAVLAALLLALSAETYRIVGGSYNEEMTREWSNLDGIREVQARLPPPREGVERYISLHAVRSNRAWLYYSMLANFEPEWISSRQFWKKVDEHARAPSPAPTQFFLAASDPRPETIAMWEGRGFRHRATFESRPSGTRLVLMLKD